MNIISFFTRLFGNNSDNITINTYTLIYWHYCNVIIIIIITLKVLTYTKLFITNKLYLYRQLSV